MMEALRRRQIKMPMQAVMSLQMESEPALERLEAPKLPAEQEIV
jgi:hypothetical protein